MPGSPRAGSRRTTLRAMLVIGLASALLALALGRLPLARKVEWTLYDARMRQTIDPARAPRELVMVEIDEQTLRELEPLVGRWPWPRAVHAMLIDFLARGRPRLIVYDVLFIDRDRRERFDMGGSPMTGAESDRALVDSVRTAGNVVLLAEATFAGQAAGEARTTEINPPPDRGFRVDAAVDERPAILAPFPDLAAAARAIGHNVFVLDDDGPVRRVVPFVRSEGRVVPSLGVAGYLEAFCVTPQGVRADAGGLRLGDAFLPLLRFEVPRFDTEKGRREAMQGLVRFRGPAVLPDGRTTYRTLAANKLIASENLLLNGERPLVNPADLQDALVFVGVTAAGGSDVFVTPLGSTGRVPGSQIHANVVDQLMHHRSIDRAPAWLQTLLTLAFALAVAAMTVPLPLKYGAPGTLAAGGAAGALGLAAFARGSWLSLVEPLAAVALAGVGGLAWQYFVEGREKRKVKRLFSHYVSKDVFDQVLDNPDLAELGGKRRTMTVLFSDMRGFTAMTERGAPEALVAQLNEYFTHMVAVVFRHQGTLDKFVGDMVMALFGAPLDDEAHADHAAGAALEMVRVLDELNRGWEARGLPRLGIGIGINSGEMIAGNIGAETVRSYTVIGDNVNLGARLESLNKDYGTTILVSDRTVRHLRRQYNLRALGPVTVKGKSEAVEIFELLADSEAGTPHEPRSPVPPGTGA